MRKIFLSLLFITVSMLCAVSIKAEETSFYYTFSNNTAAIIKVDNNLSGNIAVPSVHNGYPVTTIGSYAFDSCTSLESIIIPDSVTYIGHYAFSSCSNLKNITLSKNLDCIIGYYAFNMCTSLKSITIPDGVTSIGSYAFNSCTSLESIVLPESLTYIGGNAFKDCKNLSTVYYKGNLDTWNTIDIHLSGNNALQSTQIIYNFEPIEPEEPNIPIEPIVPPKPINIEKAIANQNSLKFISEVNSDEQIQSFGTTFIPLWLFEKGDINTAVVEYNNSKYNIQKGQTFGATLTNIPENYKNIPIVGKSFIKDINWNYTWSTSKYTTINDTILTELDN